MVWTWLVRRMGKGSDRSMRKMNATRKESKPMTMALSMSACGTWSMAANTSPPMIRNMSIPRVRKIFSMIVGGERDSINLESKQMGW